MAKVTITNRQAVQAIEAFQVLDKFPFESAVMFALVRNAKICKGLVEDVQETQRKIREEFAEHIDQETGDISGKPAVEFNKRNNEVMDAETEIEVNRIKASRLKPYWSTKLDPKVAKVDRPHIPLTVFVALDFMLIQDIEAANDNDDGVKAAPADDDKG